MDSNLEVSELVNRMRESQADTAIQLQGYVAAVDGNSIQLQPDLSRSRFLTIEKSDIIHSDTDSPDSRCTFWIKSDAEMHVEEHFNVSANVTARDYGKGMRSGRRSRPRITAMSRRIEDVLDVLSLFPIGCEAWVGSVAAEAVRSGDISALDYWELYDKLMEHFCHETFWMGENWVPGRP